MKVGDLVRLVRKDRRIGLVVQIEDSHRQTTANILFGNDLKCGIWEKHLETVNELD
ncbi:hypothetical protein OAA09_01150 [bacterium]|nr:hypothetical protein [bacterium]